LINITLTNHKKTALYPYKHVVFNVETKLFELEDGQSIQQSELFKNKQFSHPLFNEPYTPASNFQYDYQYNHITELMYATTFICTVLIHTHNPSACHFTIKPSATFQPTKCPETIHISTNHHKKANQSISLNQLNSLISTLSNTPFYFSNDTILYDSYTLKNFPHTIDGDALYSPSTELFQILNTLHQCDAYELRYIHPMLGFGVFSRENIKKDQFISLYSGIQTHAREKKLNYSFKIHKKKSTAYIHASQFGNLTRFINHAPDLTAPQFLTANIKTTQYQLNGLTFVMYKAAKDILAGEQLLLNYGDAFFTNEKSTPFKANGKLTLSKIIKPAPAKKISDLRIMANHGIHAAQIYFKKRIILIATIFFVALRVTHLI
jgi:hypothetical protein